MKQITFFLLFLLSYSLFSQATTISSTILNTSNIFELTEDSQFSAAFLNSPINSDSRIYISEDGHLIANNNRIRIFGTNITSIPTKEMAEYDAKLLSRLGYNCIRFHHIDSTASNCLIKQSKEGKHIINEIKLDDLDYFIYELKKHGIYSNINFLTNRDINSIDGYKPEIDFIKNKKAKHAIGFWNKEALQKQQEFISFLLNHINPYTNTAYKNEPALAIVEINNENGLMVSYLNGWLEEISGEYWKELEIKWNSWIQDNNANINSLENKYNIFMPTSEYLIDNDSLWHLELNDKAKAVLKRNKSTHYIDIEKNGTEKWHIQYYCPNIKIDKEKIYTLSFYAKASEITSINVNISQSHSPWKISNFSNDVILSTEWEKYEYTINNLFSDDNMRITFSSLGFLQGIQIAIKDPTLTEGGQIKIVDFDPIEKEFIHLPHFNEYKYLPDEYKNLIMSFLWDVESNYWKEMNSYIKEEINAKCLTIGTINGYSSPEIQSIFDIIDTHLYWNHPQFPNSDWSSTDYYVKNRSLTKAKQNNTLLNLAKQRIYGKPFCCSEYDHPYPNQFTAEMYPMISSFASFQDWDCIFTFFTSLPKTQNPPKIYIRNFFDQLYNPAKSLATPLAARVFRQNLVKAAEKNYYIFLNEQQEKKKLYKFSSQNISNPDLYGMIKSVGMSHKIGIILEENKAIIDNNLFINLMDFSQSDFPYSIALSDTNEIFWNTDTGIFAVCNDNVTITVKTNTKKFEFFDFWKKDSRLLPLKNNTEFASVMAVKENKSYLIYNCKWCKNTNDNLRDYNTKRKIETLERAEKKITADFNPDINTSIGFSIDGEMELYNHGKIVFTSDTKSFLQILEF